MLLRIGKSVFPVGVIEKFQVTQLGVAIPGIDRSFTLRLGETDAAVFEKIFIREEYNHHLPPDPKTIVDAGANVGYSVAWFKARFPDATIIAVEPDPTNFQLLQENCAHLPAVHLLNAALWSEDTDVSLVHSTPNGLTLRSWGIRTEPRVGDDCPVRKVKGVTLNTLIEKFSLDSIDILKMDIEGAEKRVFEGDLHFLSRTECIALECHDRFNPGCFAAAQNALRNGYVTSSKGENVFYYRRPDRNSDFQTYPKSIWLLSDGRSGSTWMSSLLNCSRSFAEYFEPWHPRLSDEYFGAPTIPYARPGEVPEQYREFYARVFGKRWSSVRSGPSFPKNTPVLVKDIHAMLMARAVTTEVPITQIICLVRNPVQVATSKLRLNHWEWVREPVHLLNDRALCQDWLEPFREVILAARSQFEKYIVIWAILYYVFFHQSEGGDVIYIRYSEASESIERKVVSVLQKLGLDQPAEKVFQDAFVNRVDINKMDKGRSRGYEPTAADLAYAERIIAQFGLNELLAGAD